jgi:predicted kinase
LKPAIHLLCGRIGSGKTTFAKKLEREIAAVRFTHDEWVASLYGHTPPEEDYGDIFVRVENLIWDVALSVVSAGTEVILDFGFWSRESRDVARNRACAADAIARLYYISCPRRIARSRTLDRSKNPPLDSLWIDRAAYEKLDALFEPLRNDEEYITIQGGDT